ncbi:MAG: hypothetical protein M1819_006066 [Sarea resinae]|nr:MAG: hypothetical protein M1819_006066 [Sarea resinae]
MSSQAVVNGLPSEAPKSKPNRQPQGRKPNYNKIHALPLPVKVYPLPTFIPHNPISVLQVVYTYVSQFLFPPSSHLEAPYQGYYSHETCSVHVTDPATVRALWEMGFFGKGSLSRSEPSWLDREKRRRGLLAAETSEEVTRKRREERKEFKKERARKEREAIEERLREEGKLSLPADSQPYADGDILAEHKESSSTEYVPSSEQSTINDHNAEPMEAINSAMKTIPEIPSHQSNGDKDAKRVRFSQSIQNVEATTNKDIISSNSRDGAAVDGEDDIKDQEHLQLTPEEAFFLMYGLGVLDVLDPKTKAAIPTSSLFSLFWQGSYFPPRSPLALQPDDSFLLSYVVYHHFRSLGWVVRPGIKFAVNYLLYHRGPVFSHAEFAVVIRPSYSHPYWSATEDRRKHVAQKEPKDWWWLHCVNRVQGQVRKNLVVVYVEVPPPESIDAITSNISSFLQRYRVREFALKRWVANRSRD